MLADPGLGAAPEPEPEPELSVTDPLLPVQAEPVTAVLPPRVAP